MFAMMLVVLFLSGLVYVVHDQVVPRLPAWVVTAGMLGILGVEAAIIAYYERSKRSDPLGGLVGFVGFPVTLLLVVIALTAGTTAYRKRGDLLAGFCGLACLALPLVYYFVL